MNELLVDETRTLTITPEEDFGYVHRASGVLAAALATTTDNNNKRDTGSSVKQEETDVDATSVVTPAVDKRQAHEVDVVEVLEEDDDKEEKKRKEKGILKGMKVEVDFEGVYDGNKKRTPSVTSSASSQGSVKPVTSDMKKMSASKIVSSGPGKEDLPQMFQVKYLGHRDARGLWGIKHTRRPVDEMVTAAKTLRAGTVLPLVRLVVSKEGVLVVPHTARSVQDDQKTSYTIDTISYGVQDLVYTRVFCMIVVRDTGGHAHHVHPFECHAFVCESRHAARRLTYSLAAAFQEYSKAVNQLPGEGQEKAVRIKKRFAIDLRSPDQIEADLEEETEA